MIFFNLKKIPDLKFFMLFFQLKNFDVSYKTSPKKKHDPPERCYLQTSRALAVEIQFSEKKQMAENFFMFLDG